MNNNNEQVHRSVAWFNTLLLGIVIFFLGRLVTQFDTVAANVIKISEEVAVIKTNVERHERELDKIKSNHQIQSR